jgi:hypothetical protein
VIGLYDRHVCKNRAVNGQFYVSHGGVHQDKPKLCYNRRSVGHPVNLSWRRAPAVTVRQLRSCICGALCQARVPAGLSVTGGRPFSAPSPQGLATIFCLRQGDLWGGGGVDYKSGIIVLGTSWRCVLTFTLYFRFP